MAKAKTDWTCWPDSGFSLAPIGRDAILRLEDYIVWGGSMTRTPDGRCHLFVSVWPRTAGFDGWVTHSQLGYAVAETPDGPYQYHGMVFGGRGTAGAWDRDVIHNPNLHYWDGKFHLYYNGNYGNGEYWNHRNHQRVGYAVAEQPSGPWQRFDQPLLETSPDAWDSVLTTNPSATKMPNGRYLLLYKAVGDKAPPPMRGPVMHGAAFADTPGGPFVKHPEPIFTIPGVNFAGEDPFVFTHRNRLYAILKDMQGYYYPQSTKSLVLFESADGINWQPASKPLVCTRQLPWADGDSREIFRLERPNLHLEENGHGHLFTAAKPSESEDDAYNIRIEVKFEG